MSQPQSLSSVLAAFVDRAGMRERIDAERAVAAWGQLVGPAIAGVTEQVWMREGVLHVKVRSAAWRHQLQFQREAWRDRLNAHLGHAVVRDVAFR